MKIELKDHVVVITGAAGNLGTAVARRFHTAGALIAMIDRSPERLSGLLPEIAGSNDNFVSHPTDVTDASSVETTINQIVQRYGRLDVLVNTAGGYKAGTPVHEMTLQDWDFMLNLNARSVFLTCRAVIPQMLEQKRGKIINTSSRAALSGEALHSAYSVSKTAVLRLTETMASELKDAGINVNCVLPGIIDTPPNRKAIPDADFSKWATPDSIADVILFLAGDAATSIHGAAIPVYGRS